MALAYSVLTLAQMLAQFRPSAVSYRAEFVLDSPPCPRASADSMCTRRRDGQCIPMTCDLPSFERDPLANVSTLMCENDTRLVFVRSAVQR